MANHVLVIYKLSLVREYREASLEMLMRIGLDLYNKRKNNLETIQRFPSLGVFRKRFAAYCRTPFLKGTPGDLLLFVAVCFHIAINNVNVSPFHHT